MLKKDAQGKFTCSARLPSEPKSQHFYVIVLAPLDEESEIQSSVVFLCIWYAIILVHS
jgi:hypothetical protein